ncbi:L-lactate dehydrogenase (quinone) large subunit LdhH [Desulfatirhabdium butyrativorans]|uniref:L-lactate dehydrogenase (quinone) large subunit LdhH n=1 Tax=Desulfatirhabdium butyrativorans TaxID=340467 RepID=UPI0004219D79|nr:LUD domain-containing protein [Desulfatirhabdium butyrativorans]
MIETPHDLAGYHVQIRNALGNQFLRTALGNFASAYKISRQKAFEGIDLERKRAELATAKDQALKRLPELYAEFKRHAEARGTIVHLAHTAEEARGIVSHIAKDNRVRHIIKSKSMTAEEIHLNNRLETDGFQVTETDLGEWIIQLRHEGPSHMVMPAIHLSRQQVGTLFSQVTGQQLDLEDIGRMVKVARRELREAFLTAGMGVSGANFAIAQTGTIGMLTNEGNGRLTTTLPGVHVAIVGIEKLVPDIDTALRIIEILPRNATGQAITSYATWITGQTPCLANPDGKKIHHVVFLDNGRLRLAEDPVFSQALRCIRCGACANVCPVYGKVGGHTLGHVYIGAIGLILTYFYHGTDNTRAIVRNCLNCQACKSVCPVNIDLPYLIKEVYRRVLDDDRKKPLKNRLVSTFMKNRTLFHSALKAAAAAQKPFVDASRGIVRHLPYALLKAEHDFRALPALAETPFRNIWPAVRYQLSNPRYRVALFVGCAVDFVSPEQALALVKLAIAFNVQIDFPQNQTCCGLPAAMMAEQETAVEVGLQNIAALDAERYDYVLTLCASCASHLKEGYPKMLAGKIDAGRIDALHQKIIDFSSFMVDVLGVEPDAFQKTGRRVAYHSPCHLCRGLGVTEAPRKLIDISGSSYVPCPEEDVCCGFGGSYSIEFPEISAAILSQKLDHVERSGADILVTDCPGCVMQLRGGMLKRNKAVPVKHIAEIVAERLNLSKKAEKAT